MVASYTVMNLADLGYEWQQALKYEVCALAANLSLNNPELYHRKWGPADASEGPEVPISAPLPEDVKPACMHLLVCFR